jgi:hypothetical protein
VILEQDMTATFQMGGDDHLCIHPSYVPGNGSGPLEDCVTCLELSIQITHEEKENASHSSIAFPLGGGD